MHATMNKVLLLLGLTHIATAALTEPKQTAKCNSGCFKEHEDVYYCSHSRETGYCCPSGSTATECIEDAANEVYCSNSIANGTLFMRYTYCPRKTNPCVTSGPVLRPLLN